MNKRDAFFAYLAYLQLLADDAYWEADAAMGPEVDPERTSAWSYAFERNDEHRLEMEADDARGFT